MTGESRRDFIRCLLASGAYAATYSGSANAAVANGIPGPYPGRVIAVERPGAVVERKYNREAVRAMLNKGMMELTEAPSAADAWKKFFEPGDVVGLKLNPVGRPYVISAPEVVQEIIAGIRSAGVPAKNIVAYDRYHQEFLDAGFDKWLPEGVRWTFASDNYA